MYIVKMEFQDELLEGEQKFRITKEDGTILADNCTIELVTILLQQGTELNKDLFDKIGGFIDYINKKDKGDNILKYANGEVGNFAFALTKFDV